MSSLFGFANKLNPDEAVEAAEVAFDALDEQPNDPSAGEITRRSLTGIPDEADIGKVNVEEAFRETEDLLLRFLRNSYVDAIEEISKKAKLHFAYCQGKANFMILKAIVTLDPEEIEVALKACQEAIDMCNENRRKTGWLSSWFWKPDANDYTDEEMHAELGFAEATILMALLICLTERTLIGLVKAGFRIQSSMGAFIECRRILRERSQYLSDDSKAHFESGVRMGIGGYNMITSHLPDRILRLVSFMGMGGNRSYGLRQLEKAAFMEKGIRAPLAGMALLGYMIKVEFILGLGEVNFEYVKKLLDHMNKRIEGSALLNIFYGMYEESLGHPNQAIEYYASAKDRIQHWVQAHHGCYWLMLWCHAVQRDWDKCTELTKLLLDECRWSPATFNYMYAMFLYMKHGKNASEEIKSDIARMMSIVPGIRHRIAGKTVHLEKFVELRSYLFFTEKETMLHPILELFYLWNIFPAIQHNPALIKPFLADIEDSLEIYTRESPEESRHRFYYLTFFKGICLRYLGQIDEALVCFKDIIASESDINEAMNHLPPHAALELGLAFRKLDRIEEAMEWLNKAIYNYSNYMNATTVHIRAHTAMTIIRQSQETTRKSAAEVDAEIEAKLREMREAGINGIDESVKAAIEIDPSLEVEDLS